MDQWSPRGQVYMQRPADQYGVIPFVMQGFQGAVEPRQGTGSHWKTMGTVKHCRMVESIRAASRKKRCQGSLRLIQHADGEMGGLQEHRIGRGSVTHTDKDQGRIEGKRSETRGGIAKGSAICRSGRDQGHTTGEPAHRVPEQVLWCRRLGIFAHPWSVWPLSAGVSNSRSPIYRNLTAPSASAKAPV